jgi:hypothetical protein
MGAKWYETSYHRTESTMHFSEASDLFLSQFDPDKYAETLRMGDIDTTYFMSSSHSGECYWPTKVGHPHRALGGRDLLAEVIDACHRRGINVVFYYSVIFNNWASRTHPEWRMVDGQGRTLAGEFWHGRGKVCCPSSPYTDFVLREFKELARYDAEGVWVDMLFWPGVCHCSHCRARYAKQAGRDIPRTVDWRDPAWVGFQRTREQWLAELARSINSTILAISPEMTVFHQGAGFINEWLERGVSLELAAQSEFMNADIYGDFLEWTFCAKLFSGLGRHPRFDFESCRTYRREHTSNKPRERLQAEGYLVLAHNGAIRFFDRVNPLGVFHLPSYELMGSVHREFRPYEQYLGGSLCRDIGIYINFESGFDLGGFEGATFSRTGTPIADPYQSGWQRPPLSAMNVARTLLNAHLPFTVITKKNLPDLYSFQLVILPNLAMIDTEEAAAFRSFVAAGGGLYASKYTSLLTKHGEQPGDFQLADLFGVSFVGETSEAITYAAPRPEAASLFPFYGPDYPVTVPDSHLLVRAREGANVLATVGLPWFDPQSSEVYSLLSSDPPGVQTDYPAVVQNAFGRGRVIYAAAALEALKSDLQRDVFLRFVRRLAPRPHPFEAEAPRCVELLLYDQPEKRRYLLNVVNIQGELPNVPVDGIKVRIAAVGGAKRVISLPGEEPIIFSRRDGWVELTVPRVQTFAMVALDY